jgi:hypothetical protein
MGEHWSIEKFENFFCKTLFLPFYVSALHILKGSIPLVPYEIAEKLRKTPERMLRPKMTKKGPKQL